MTITVVACMCSSVETTGESSAKEMGGTKTGESQTTMTNKRDQQHHTTPHHITQQNTGMFPDFIGGKKEEVIFL